VYSDLPLTLRTLRDLVTYDVEKVRIDSCGTFREVTEFIDTLVPEIVIGLNIIQANGQYSIYLVSKTKYKRRCSPRCS
jgi:Ribonuclease G/E